MDVFEFAIKMEQDGEKFYREIAALAQDEGVKNLMDLLAADEVKHAQVLERMRKNIAADLTETRILAGAKNVFAGLLSRKDLVAASADQAELYRRALAIEKKSRDFYLKEAARAERESVKLVLERIAEEEKKHAFLLENMIEFIQRPKTWLESAEFNHLEEY